MAIDANLINITVTICDRPYKLKVKPDEEENVRRAAKLINNRVKDLQSEYGGKDKQDFLAMASLMFEVENLGAKSSLVIKDRAMQDKIGELESRLDQVLSG